MCLYHEAVGVRYAILSYPCPIAITQRDETRSNRGDYWMGEDAEMLTLEEALACIKLHFTEPEGLVAHIESGLGIDDVQVQVLKVALRRLHIAWQEQDLVPK